MAILQRKIAVSNPDSPIADPSGTGGQQTNAQTVQDYLTKLCPVGGIAIADGAVQLAEQFCERPWRQGNWPWPFTESPASGSQTPVSCNCLCQLVESNHLWEIFVKNIENDLDNPMTVPKDQRAGLGESSGCGGCALAPSGTGGTIVVPSPNSRRQFGSAKQTAENSPPRYPFLSRDEPWMVLAHELCGHAARLDVGEERRADAETRGRGGHRDAVAIENAIRAEHDMELRATFCGPYCGESFWIDTSSGSKAPHWFRNRQRGPDFDKEFKAMCQESRDRYNRAHGIAYTIEDRLPGNCIR